MRGKLQVDEGANAVEDDGHVGIVEKFKVREVLEEVADVLREERHSLNRAECAAVDTFQRQRDAHVQEGIQAGTVDDPLVSV